MSDGYQYDPGTPIDSVYFGELLEASRILLWLEGEKLWTAPKDQKNWRRYEYWRYKSEDEGWDGLSCYAAKPILTTLLPTLIKNLRFYRDAVIAGKYYWAHRNPQFLKLVYETSLPEDDAPDALISWGNRFNGDRQYSDYQVTSFILEAQKPKKKTKSKKEEK